MFQFVKKLLYSRQFTFDEGSITLLGQPVMLAPTSLFSGMVKELHADGNEEILYKMARTAGHRYGERAKQRQHFDPVGLYEWGLQTVALAGLGTAESVKFDGDTPEAVIRVWNSAIAEGLHPADFPVDYALAGYIAGYCTVVFDTDAISCHEKRCQAMGAESCVFQVAPD